MPSISNTQKRAILGFCTLTLIWAYNWVVMKKVLQYIGPFDFSALRAVLGTTLLFCILRFRDIPLRPPPLIPTIVIGVLQIGGMVGLAQFALVSGGAGKVAILVYTMPFWVILLAALLLGEKIRLLQYFSIFTAAIGIILLSQFWNMNSSWQSSLLAVASGFFWAASAIAAKKTYSLYPNINLLSLTAWQMLIGTMLLSAVSFAVPEKPPIWNEYVFFALAFNVILSTVLGWALWLYLLKNLPTGVAGLSTLAIPVCGIFFAFIELNEIPTLTEDIGIILIIIALGLVCVQQLRTDPQTNKANESDKS